MTTTRYAEPEDARTVIAATAATWVFAVLLGVAGARKIVSPAATEAALHGARLPSTTAWSVCSARRDRAGGAALLGRRPIRRWLLALAYAAFAVFA